MLKSLLEEELLQIQKHIRNPYDAWVQKFNETTELVFASQQDHGESGNPEKSIPFFPKTPIIRKTRKRPLVPTIVEDDEESVVVDSPIVEVLRVRGSRAASKNANLKLKEVKLNQKLRRPSKKCLDDTIVIECRTTRTTQSTVCLSSPDVFSDSNFEVPTVINKKKQHDISVSSIDDDMPLQAIVNEAKRQTRLTVKKENVPPPKVDVPNVCEKEARVHVERMNEASINSALNHRDIPVPVKKSKKGKSRNKEDEPLPMDVDEDVPVCEMPAVIPVKLESEATNNSALNRRDSPVTAVVKKSKKDKSRKEAPSMDVGVEVPICEKSAEVPEAAANHRDSPVTAVVKKSKKDKSRKEAPSMDVGEGVPICEKSAEVPEAAANHRDSPVVAFVKKSKKDKSLNKKDKSLNKEALPMDVDEDVAVFEKPTMIPAKRANEAAAIAALNRRDAQLQLSVKKRVNDYERLVGVEPSSSVGPPVRMTRTKMRKLADDAERREALQTSDNKSSSNIVTSVDSFIPKLVKATAENVEEKRKDELKRRKEKEAEAAKKRKEMTDLKIEMQKKKREEKFQKVQMSREAMEREKLEQLLRIEREKEERARQQVEREEKLKEELLRKKHQAQQKALEMEERRRQDEIARLARIKEQEEEQQRILAQRRREEEEAARQQQKRIKEEREAAAVREAMEKKEKLLKMKAAKKAAAEQKQLDGTFVVEKNEAVPAVRPPLKAFSEENYELQDLSEGDSDDENDDFKNKHRIPAWVNHPSMNQLYRIQNAMKLSAVDEYFGSHATTPNLSEMFDNPKLGIIPRSSSAVWRTPPRYSRMPKS